MKLKVEAWGVLWKSKNKLNGVSQHICRDDNCVPALFNTRKEARKFIDLHYGYIRTRIDLQHEPHGWRIPKAVKVKVDVK